MGENKRHHYIDTVEQALSDAAGRGIIQLTLEDDSIAGTRIRVGGRDLISFGSCSYLGLEQDERLIAGVVDAVRRYGTQFSSSRAYMSLPLYEELEETLGRIFDKPVLVTPSTSLGHQAALPVLIRDEDAIILDHQVHASVQTAVQILKPRGIPVKLARHNSLEHLEELIQQLRPHHRHIWYLADGVYSMYGDFAPTDELQALLQRYEQLHIYFDDAHGMTWHGARGCGFIHSRIPDHPRVMLAVSLNKAFACAGGALVFPNREWARKVRTAGPTLVFSGPVQPPMLGAALASARLHVDGELVPLQTRLRELIEYTRNRLQAHHLPLLSLEPTPIFFIPTGLPRVAYNLIGRLFREGVYTNIGTFPATPMQRGGVRFTITAQQCESDIDRLADLFAEHYLPALVEEGVSPEDVEQAFNPPLQLGALRAATGAQVVAPRWPLTLAICEHIDDLDTEAWDGVFAGRGPFSASYFRMLETVFASRGYELAGVKPENHWQFRYVTVRDGAGALVLAAPMTAALMKDDLFSPAETSAQIEVQRRQDPYWLTSRIVMLGSAGSEGDPLYVRRDHRQWREALGLCADALRQFGDEVDASLVLLRDFDVLADDDLTAELLRHGFVQMTLPDRFWVPTMEWQTEAEYLASLSARYRYSLRKEALAYRDLFDVHTERRVPTDLRHHCFDLYLQVQARGRQINTFPLPEALIEAYFAHEECDVIRLHLRGDPEWPVAVMFSHVADGVYSAGYVGLDYRYLDSHKIYKQILFRTVERARELGCRSLHLGFTAGLEKRKVGAVARPTCGYGLVRDHFNLDVVESMTLAPTVKTG